MFIPCDLTAHPFELASGLASGSPTLPREDARRCFSAEAHRLITHDARAAAGYRLYRLTTLARSSQLSTRPVRYRRGRRRAHTEPWSPNAPRRASESRWRVSARIGPLQPHVCWANPESVFGDACSPLRSTTAAFIASHPGFPADRAQWPLGHTR